ncbi:MAG: S9 family peptidase [Pseudomonadota bacterium]
MLLSILAAAALHQALPDPAASFGALPLISGLQPSPSGETFVAKMWTGENAALGVFTLKNGFEYLQVIPESDDKQIDTFFWKRDDRLVFSASLPGNRFGTPTVETRLYSMNPLLKGKKAKFVELFGRVDGPGGYPIQIQDDIVSRLKNDPEHILVQYRSDGSSRGEGVYRVQVDHNRRHALIKSPRNNSLAWLADSEGRARAVYGLKNSNSAERTLQIVTPDDKYKDITHRIAAGTPSFSILGFPLDPAKAYVASDHETDTAALYVYDIPTDSFEEMLFSHPTSDIYDVEQDPKTGRAIGAVYGEDTVLVHWFEKSRAAKTVDAVKEAFGLEKLSFTRFNIGGSMAVLYSWEGNRPGNYMVFDYASGQAISMPAQYPDLANIELGKVIPTSYKARDGLEIPAFVTLPPGIDSLEAAKNLPVVLNPHGGPTARDFADFDYLTQFLAHKGYAVLQMNFRGSAGYGAAFENAGDREWGQAMQDDITDGAKWLVSKGIANPDRLAILGGSYGGYAALMGAAKTPDLYQCAVSINGVTDLPRLIRHANQYVGGRASTRYIGRLWKDRRMLAENSPVKRADDIQIPILLIHGEKDRRVRYAHTQVMDRALKRNNKDVTLVKLKDGSHFLDVNDNRITALREVDAFLGKCL